MDETTAPGSPHELLLRLAGRVDDDLLADARELVAVGEDGHALELVTAALAAEGATLPTSVRAELVAAARMARIDLDADTALAPAAPDTTAHRFTASPAADVAVMASVRELPARLVDGVRLRLSWRQTPAGSAPGPLPHPVLLVETPEGGRPGEVLAYQVGAALARSGAHVSVEVLTSGRPLTTYHADALRDSTPLDGGAAARPVASPPEVVESVVAEVVEQVTASHRGLPARSDEGPVDLFAVDDEPAPRPVPMRAWQGGRRRRGFGEAADEPEQHDEPAVTPIGRAPLPSPVPLARRTRPGQGADEEQGADPLDGPLRQPLMDPLMDPMSRSEKDEDEWADEWATGDWAVAEPVDVPASEDPANPPPSGGTATPPPDDGGRPTLPEEPGGPAHALDPARGGSYPTAAAQPSHALDPTHPGHALDPAHPAYPTTAAQPSHALDPTHPGHAFEPVRPPDPSGDAHPTATTQPGHALGLVRSADRAETDAPDHPTGPAHTFTPAVPSANGAPPEMSAHPQPGATTYPAVNDDPATPVSGTPTVWGGSSPTNGSPPPPPEVPRSVGAADMSDLLKPEAMARLSDADRELLARLQAELGNAGSPAAEGTAAGPRPSGVPGPTPHRPGSPATGPSATDRPGPGQPGPFGEPHAAPGLEGSQGAPGTNGATRSDSGPNGSGPGNGRASGPGYPASPPDLAG